MSTDAHFWVKIGFPWANVQTFRHLTPPQFFSVNSNTEQASDYTESVNADVFKVFPGDVCHLFYAGETFSEQVV